MSKTGPYLDGRSTLKVAPQLDGRSLKVSVDYTRDLRWFFRRDDFEIRYADDISADPGLLSVPAVGLLLPLAWLTGSNLRVETLDRQFGEAAEDLQRAFSKMYPKAPFETELIVEQWTDSPPNPEGSALMFSGGLDATYSFFANRHLKPRLIQVLGTEFSQSQEEFVERVRQHSSEFATRHQVPLSMVRSDVLTVFDERCVLHRFIPVREQCHGDLWKGMGYALGFLSMAAPLSAGRFNHLIIGAWANREHADRMRENPDASSPKVDQKIRWSNVRVEHHGCLHRFEKAREMKDWLPGNPMRVCWLYWKALLTPGALNCSQCEKCARTIVSLVVGGVDPESCGFKVTLETVAYMKQRLQSGTIAKSHLALWWGPAQREIPEQLEGDMYGLREFLEWFRDFDLGDGLDDPPSKFSIHTYYPRFPYPVALAIRTLYYRIVGQPRLPPWLDKGSPSGPSAPPANGS